MQLCPALARWILHRVGPGRVAAISQPGAEGAYNLSKLLRKGR